MVWRSFELDPDAPAERVGDYAEKLAAKYGFPVAQGQQMIDTMTATAAQDGLDFHFETARVGNTFDAHRLLHLAGERGVQDAVKERLLRATFTEGEPIGDHETLVRLGVEAGLDADEARAVLASDRYAAEVRGDEAQARAYGITGVPFFVVDGRYGVSGAQPAEALGQVLATGLGRGPPLQLVTAGGDRPRLRRRRLRRLTRSSHVRAEQVTAARARFVRRARLLSLPAGTAGLAARGARAARRRPGPRAGRAGPPGAQRRPDPARPGRAQGRRAQGRAAAVDGRGAVPAGPGGDLARGAGLPAGRQRSRSPSPRWSRSWSPSWGRRGASCCPPSTSRRPRPPRSGRCTGRCGPTGARSRSRCSTPGSARR